MLTTVRSFLKDENGGMAIEYGLIAGLIAVVLVGAFTALQTDITELFGRIGGQVDAAAPAGG